MRFQPHNMTQFMYFTRLTLYYYLLPMMTS